jgi:hypothetical protein
MKIQQNEVLHIKQSLNKITGLSQILQEYQAVAFLVVALCNHNGGYERLGEIRVCCLS